MCFVWMEDFGLLRMVNFVVGVGRWEDVIWRNFVFFSLEGWWGKEGI